MNEAPTKRRRGKAKRSKCPKPQGTIKEYFCQIFIPKGWSTILENEGAGSARPMLEGAGGSKRKCDLLVEDPIQQTMPNKSLRLSVEDDEENRGSTNSGTYGPFIRGARSRTEGMMMSGRGMISGKGLDLKSLTTKEGGNAM